MNDAQMILWFIGMVLSAVPWGIIKFELLCIQFVGIIILVANIMSQVGIHQLW